MGGRNIYWVIADFGK